MLGFCWPHQEKILLYGRNSFNLPPKLVSLKVPEGKSQPTGIVEEFSQMLSPSRVLLGGMTSFQVWDIDLEMYISSAKLILQGDLKDSQQETYLNIITSSKYIVGVTSTKLTIWNLHDINDTEVEVEMEKDTVITAVHIDNYLITGDNRGIISVRRLQDGSLIRTLNSYDAPTPNAQNSKIGVLLDHRINCIQRSGNFVWIGTEDSRIAVYAFSKSNARTSLAELELDSLSTKSVLVKDGVVYFKVSVQKQAKKKEDISCGTHVVIWAPQFNVSLPLEPSYVLS